MGAEERPGPGTRVGSGGCRDIGLTCSGPDWPRTGIVFPPVQQSRFLSISYLHTVTMLAAPDPIHHLPTDDPLFLSTTTIIQNGPPVLLDAGTLGLLYTTRSLDPHCLHPDQVSHFFSRILHCHMSGLYEDRRVRSKAVANVHDSSLPKRLRTRPSPANANRDALIWTSLLAITTSR